MKLMADIILGIMVITLILGMLSIIPMAIPVGLILIDALLYGIDTFTTKEMKNWLRALGWIFVILFTLITTFITHSPCCVFIFIAGVICLAIDHVRQG